MHREMSIHIDLFNQYRSLNGLIRNWKYFGLLSDFLSKLGCVPINQSVQIACDLNMFIPVNKLDY